MKTKTCIPVMTMAAEAVLVNPSRIRWIVPCVLFALAGVNGQLKAQERETKISEFVPFQAFLDQTQATDSIGKLRPGTDVKVKEAAALHEMRQHILTMYQGEPVTHSFVRDSSHFDCVPIDKQPSVRILGLQTIAEAPPKSALAGQRTVNDLDALPTNPASQELDTSNDDFGNAMGCEANTVPIRRLTLEEMVQFPTLRDFFRKQPEAPNSLRKAAVSPDSAKEFLAPTAHKYSQMYRYVDNLGGNSNLNLWSPYVNTGLGEIFSLSQEWYIGGTGAATQTAEVGWQNFPNKYGSQSSRLFIYFTGDNYNSTGCYNLDCPGFVQVSNTAHIGGGFGGYSTAGGAQYEFSAEYYLYQGNWWLAISGNWVGYYPVSLYRGGQMSRYAQKIEFGTESVGTTVWPPEGSGFWSTSGLGYAAYQRNLFYFNTGGIAVPDGLLQYDPSPRCYTTSGPFSSASSGVYFYEGGPGGTGCQ
jgi:hypothetical protein